MSRTTGPILAVGAITMTRDLLDSAGSTVSLSVPIATGVAAVAFGLLERVNEDFAVGLAWIAVVTVLLGRTDPNKPSAVESFAAAFSSQQRGARR